MNIRKQCSFTNLSKTKSYQFQKYELQERWPEYRSVSLITNESFSVDLKFQLQQLEKSSQFKKVSSGISEHICAYLYPIVKLCAKKCIRNWIQNYYSRSGLKQTNPEHIKIRNIKKPGWGQEKPSWSMTLDLIRMWNHHERQYVDKKHFPSSIQKQFCWHGR